MLCPVVSLKALNFQSWRCCFMCLKVKVAQKHHTVPKQKRTTIHVFPQKKKYIPFPIQTLPVMLRCSIFLNMLRGFLLFCRQYVHECHAVDPWIWTTWVSRQVWLFGIRAWAPDYPPVRSYPKGRVCKGKYPYISLIYVFYMYLYLVTCNHRFKDIICFFNILPGYLLHIYFILCQYIHISVDSICTYFKYIIFDRYVFRYFYKYISIYIYTSPLAKISFFWN